MVAVINDVGMWEEIVAFIVQMKSLKIEDDCLWLSQKIHTYFTQNFILHCKEHGLVNNLHQVAQGWNTLDRCRTCCNVRIWAPSSIFTGENLRVSLDVLVSFSKRRRLLLHQTNMLSRGVPT